MFGWRRKPVSQPHTIIDRDTEIRGPLHSRGTLEIRGFVIGEVVHRGSLVIAPGGVCTGPVQADELFLRGEVHGDVAVSGTLRIGNGGQLFGDASCRRLIIDAGGRFVGKNLSGADEEADVRLAPLRRAEVPQTTVPAEPEPVRPAPEPEPGAPQGTFPPQQEEAGADPSPPTSLPEAEVPLSPEPAQPEAVQPEPLPAAEEPPAPVGAGLQVESAPVQPEAPAPAPPEPQPIVFHGFMRPRRTPADLAVRQNQ